MSFAHPCTRETPFDPPAALAERRSGPPIVAMRYPDGHDGWLVTSHSLARSILTDARFSARSEFKRPPVARPGADPFYGAPALPGWLVDMDAPEHTRLRRQLTGRFTARRMREITPRVQGIVADLLDDVEAAGAPADLVRLFAMPLPSRMICELLGVPYSERAAFQRHSETLFSLQASAEDGAAAMDALYALVREIATLDADAPEAGLLAQLTAEGTLDHDEIAGLGVLLLTAGHESTAKSLALSVFALLAHPDQLDRLRTEPELIDNAVEELLRYLTVFHFGVPRTPLEDVELDGELIRAGESITISLPLGNRDPSWFTGDPDRLDLGRKATGHLAFGYGIHQCLGQNLVRVELRTALPAIFDRFPGLHLAVPQDEIPLSTDMSVYGVHSLPVGW